MKVPLILFPKCPPIQSQKTPFMSPTWMIKTQLLESTLLPGKVCVSTTLILEVEARN